jgi:2-polyprenyl-3-methyl-5-hydroxy-6-metoxy-1,4-benzoquinol methylase
MALVNMLEDFSLRLNNELKALHHQIFHSQNFVEVDCPVCGSAGSTLYGVKDAFSYRRCNVCTMIYMSPRLSDVATLAFYNSKANEIYNEIKFHGTGSNIDRDNLVNYHNLEIILKRVGSPSEKGESLKLLEVGCGSGYFLKSAQNAGFDVYGLELNVKLLDNAKKLLGVETIYGIDVQECDFPNEQFDVIYLRDVIEHIHSPMSFLRKLSALLKVGGILFIETHNVDGFIFKAVGIRHTCFFGFEHPVHWSSKTLGLALNKCGLDLADIKFESQDCTLYEIVHYYREPTFTTIFKGSNNRIIDKFLGVALRLLRIPIIKFLDSLVTPKVANLFGYGSTMKFIAIKSK